jgi:hypothetical protein
MYCLYEKLADGRWRCPACADETSRAIEEPPIRVCGRPLEGPPPPPPPSIFKKLTHFAPALIGHVLGGMPSCTQEQIDARLAICRACPGGHYLPDPDNPNLGVCTNCGCNAGREQKFLNKLGWADQACPAGYWTTVSSASTN